MKNCIFPARGQKCLKNSCCERMNCVCCLSCGYKKSCTDRCPHIGEKLDERRKAARNA